MPRTVASIEARMGSSRLPGKVLMDICGTPAIGRLVERLRRCRKLDDIVLATSTAYADDQLCEWAIRNKVKYYRGSENDVLERVVEAHESVNSDVVVEITGDCPLLDHEVIDWGIETFVQNDADVVSNTWKQSFPMGIDVQVFKLEKLKEVERTVFDPPVREHVSLYFYENPQKYRILNLVAPEMWKGEGLRFQLDYEEDLKFIRTVYNRLGSSFGVQDVLGLLAAEPEIAAINRHCVERDLR